MFTSENSLEKTSQRIALLYLVQFYRFLIILCHCLLYTYKF